MVVFASTNEGFGMPIIESNAVGRPVVTSNVTSMPEIAGEAACIVDPFKIDSIRHGILKVIEDSTYRQNLIKEGFINILRFKPKKIAHDYTKLYEQIIFQNQ
jgi:glycosyltransferase involved in cell wall biosynthesis